MTERERLSREMLIKRAVAAVGAAYVAPVLTSSAAAEATACAGQKCKPGKKGARKCKRLGGRGCKCMDGRCGGGKDCGPICCDDCAVGPVQFCDTTGLCGSGSQCVCVLNYATGRCNCAAFTSGFCSDYPQCDRNGNGSDCPRGTCCMQLGQSCPNGVCMAPCDAAA
jgi:hypothetical protein